MRRSRRALGRLAAAGAALLALVGPASGQSPTDQMRQYMDEVLKVFRETTLRENDTIAGVRAAVRKAVIDVFGLAEAAQAVLGAHWETRTPAERAEFTRLFADFLEASYIAQMDHQRGIKIRYVGESIADDRAEVRGLVLSRRGRAAEVPVAVTLLKRGERWLVYDVAIDGVSLVGNYRAQFDRLIRKASYPEFVKAVRAKRDALLAQRPSAVE